MPANHRRRFTRGSRCVVRCQVEVLERREVPTSTGLSLLGGLPNGVAVPSQQAPAPVSAAVSEVISVSPSAWGEAVRTLAGSYTLRPLNGAFFQLPGPIIVGPADLKSALVVGLLRRAYQSGKTVGLADATEADAGRLADLLGHPRMGAWTPDAPVAALVAFRKVQDGPTAHYFSDFLPLQVVDTSTGPTSGSPGTTLGALNPLTRGWVGRVFAARAVLPTSPSAADGSPNLLQLANSYESSKVAHDSNGNEEQVVNTVWDVRSFQNQADYYYVLQEIDFLGESTVAQWQDGAFTFAIGLQPSALIQQSPQTTQQTTTVTSGTSYSIGGSFGFNQQQGFNAGVSGGVSIVNSKTVSTPPVQVQDRSSLTQALPSWLYLTTNTPSFNTELSFYNQWIWSVPFSAYSSGQTSFSFHTHVEQQGIVVNNGTRDVVYDLPTSYNASVPLPFGRTFALQKPVVTSVSPSTVHVGDTFTITGTGFYPSLVTGVLINGRPLAATQYSTVSDIKITAVAPDHWSLFSQQLVVQTTQGISNDNVKITIYPKFTRA